MSYEKIKETAEFLEKTMNGNAEIGIILGSGLGEFSDCLENKKAVSFKDVPNMPVSTVKGHLGQFIFGELYGKKIICMKGRVHYYEGNKIEDVVLAVRAMKLIGVKTLIVTNAAGGVNESFEEGDLMIIKDHVNLAFTNPLIGKNIDELGERFPDMNNAYDSELKEIALSCGKDMKLNLREGTYFMMSGPSYETPAEIKMVRILGADAVGMSTVPEVIAARHCNIKVLGISCITNMAAGIKRGKLSHEEVINTTERVKINFIKLLKSIINII